MEGIVEMRTSDDPNPPHIGNLPIDNLISLYYVLWILLGDRSKAGKDVVK
jgi:hypothetical protein